MEDVWRSEGYGRRAILISRAMDALSDAVNDFANTSATSECRRIWLSEEARAVVCAAAGMTATVRERAMRALRTLAREENNQREMWQHAETRAALLRGATDGADAVRTLAIAVLRELALLDVNARKMWEDAETRAALLGAAKPDVAEGVREEAVNALNNLAEEIESHPEMWHSLGVRAALLEAAKPDSADDVRECAVGALESLATEAANQREMWGHYETHVVLLGATRSDVDDGVRAEAYGALRNLAQDPANKREIWEHAGTRAALLAGAQPDVAYAARKRALSALRNLCTEDANKRRMWAHAGCRAALLELACDSADEVRAIAVDTLRSIASDDDMVKSEMWEDEAQTRRVLLTAAADACDGVRRTARALLESVMPPQLDRAALLDVAVGTFRGTRKRGVEAEVADELKRLRSQSESLKHETESLVDARNCVVCKDAPRDTLVLPCRHLAVCGGCCAQLPRARCPICRAIVRDTVLVIAS